MTAVMNHTPSIDDAPKDEGGFTPPPPRKRRRLVTPVTGGLAAVMLVSAGFLGGVEVQKNSAGATTPMGMPDGGELPSFADGAPSFPEGQRS